MINAIFAVDEAGGLGYQNHLPWPSCKEDLLRFKALTLDHTVIMGRNTWDSLPESMRPLPHRHNVIVTSTPHCFAAVSGIETIHPTILDLYLTKDCMYQDVFIIGGKQVIMNNLHLIDYIYLTVMKGTFNADVALDMDAVLKNFKLVHEVDPYYNCTFKEYKYETIS